jgi:hypothetical protein
MSNVTAFNCIRASAREVILDLNETCGEDIDRIGDLYKRTVHDNLLNNENELFDK